MRPTVVLLAVSLPLRAQPCARNQPQIANAGPNKIAYVGRTRAIEQAPADPACWHESLGVVGFEAYGPEEIVIARPTTVFTHEGGSP
jgi:hypothetical protein